MINIELRVWDEMDKKMYYHPDVRFKIDNGVHVFKVLQQKSKRRSHTHIAISKKHRKIMLFSNEKDMKDKKIWQCDILECYKKLNKKYNMNGGEPELGVVEWFNSGLFVSYKTEEGGYSEIDSKHMKVIGDIYRSPEIVERLKKMKPEYEIKVLLKLISDLNIKELNTGWKAEYDKFKRKVENLFLKRNPTLKREDLKWRMDGRLEWVCEHRIGHTVYAPAIKQDDGEMFRDWIHGCDWCCKGIKTIRSERYLK